MVVGTAVKLMMRGTGNGVTVTETAQVAVAPPAPVAVTVKFVVAVGLTATVPFNGTLPTPGVMVTAVAFTVWYAIVVDSPELMFIGVAVQNSTCVCSGFTTTVVVAT